MNTRIITALVLGLGLTLTGLTSCKKCMKCTYTETNTHIPREREQCGGNTESRELFKDDVIKEASFFGVDEDDVSCEYK